jgi:hypothetical protein
MIEHVEPWNEAPRNNQGGRYRNKAIRFLQLHNIGDEVSEEDINKFVIEEMNVIVPEAINPLTGEMEQVRPGTPGWLRLEKGKPQWDAFTWNRNKAITRLREGAVHHRMRTPFDLTSLGDGRYKVVSMAQAIMNDNILQSNVNKTVRRYVKNVVRRQALSSTDPFETEMADFLMVLYQRYADTIIRVSAEMRADIDRFAGSLARLRFARGGSSEG